MASLITELLCAIEPLDRRGEAATPWWKKGPPELQEAPGAASHSDSGPLDRPSSSVRGTYLLFLLPGMAPRRLP